MDYKAFFQQYGAGLRRKNIPKSFLLTRLIARTIGGRRRFPLPQTASIPQDFIRLDPWEAEYLFCVARRARRGIVEVGRFNGGSSFLMSCANPDVSIHSVDISPRDDDKLRELFKKNNTGKNVHLIVGDSQHTKYPEVGEYDVLFIDGDHTYEGCMADILNWYPKLSKNGHMVFHDSYLGAHGVQDAIIDFIEEHPKNDVVIWPFMGASYWQNSTGSMAHIIKREDVTA